MPELAAKKSSNSLQRLRKSARELFVRDGYHNTRPQDIARVAGVANGTFYLHFSDKQQAFIDFAEEAQSELIQHFIQNLEAVTDHRERWRVIFATVVDYGSKHPGLLNAAFLDPVLIAPGDDNAWRMYDRLGEFVNLALREKTSCSGSDYDLALISHGICGMLRHAMTYASRKQLETEKLIDDLSLFIDRGLGLA